MVVTVRSADLRDAPALALLRWQWRAGERGESGLGRDEFVGAFSVWMSEHEESHLAWLAEEESAAVGMAWLAVVHRIPGPGRWSRLSGNLQSVYVVPERRGAGTGELLVRTVIGRARRMGIEYMAVHPSKRSFSLYRRLHFEESPEVLELRGKDFLRTSSC